MSKNSSCVLKWLFKKTKDYVTKTHMTLYRKVCQPCSMLIKIPFHKSEVFSKHYLFLLYLKETSPFLRKYRLSKPNQLKNTDSTMKLVKSRARKGSRFNILN